MAKQLLFSIIIICLGGGGVEGGEDAALSEMSSIGIRNEGSGGHTL